jgi:hypothetical protein
MAHRGRGYQTFRSHRLVTSRRRVERRIVRCYTGASFSRPRRRERPVELVDAMRVQSENAEVKMSKPSTWSFGLVFAVAALGCGGAPRPEARIASSQGAIRGAEEAGAAGVPQAKLHLQLAQEQRQQALELVKDDNNHRADLLLARAEADAELAVALAREATAKAEAEKAAEDAEALKQRAAQ